jgi:hypothetical protein
VSLVSFPPSRAEDVATLIPHRSGRAGSEELRSRVLSLTDVSGRFVPDALLTLFEEMESLRARD